MEQKDYERMINPDNLRSKEDGVVFSCVGGKVDYHLLENVYIQSNDTTLKEYIKVKNLESKLLKEKINGLIDLTKTLNDKIEKLESVVEKYGLK